MNGILRNMASIYIFDQENMLMLYRIGSRVVSPSWCGVGGHFEKAELNDAKACVLRELNEEMHIKESALEQIQLRYITLRLKNGEIRQNYYFFAKLKHGNTISLDCDEGQAAWISFDELMHLEMPVTAKYMMEHYLATGRYTTHLYGGNTTKEGVIFTELTEF